MTKYTRISTVPIKSVEMTIIIILAIINYGVPLKKMAECNAIYVNIYFKGHLDNEAN